MWNPLGDEPLSRDATWPPEPGNGRGTYTILSSCLITLSLCLWSSLHLNIAEHGKASYKTGYKLKWLVIGLVAPEAVAFAAWKQWRAQKLLSSKIQKAIGHLLPAPEKKPSLWATFKKSLTSRPKSEVLNSVPTEEPCNSETDAQKRQFPWTPAHSFFVTMGGFVLDASKSSQKVPFPGRRSRVTLTTNGVLWLAENAPELLPDLSAENIQDKSKTNHLAKALVCIQASWFCFQVLTRLGFGLATSLLELNTFAHAFFALFVYLIWWDKPLDIEEPYLIPVCDKLVSISAAMCMSSTMACRKPAAAVRKDGDAPPEFIQARYRYAIVLADGTEASGHKPDSDKGTSTVGRGCADGDTTGLVTLEHGQSYHGLVFARARFGLVASSTIPPSYRVITKISEDDAALGRLVRQARQAEDRAFLPSLPPEAEEIPDKKYDFVVARAQNWPFGLDSDFNSINTYHCFFAGFSAVYGAWHLLAWNSTFHSSAEALLWKVAGIGVGSATLGLIVWFTLNASVTRLEQAIEAATRDRGSAMKKLGSAAVGVLITVMGLSCYALVAFLFLSRGYLVLEAFWSLAYAPNSVFDVPNWSQYMPHIG